MPESGTSTSTPAPGGNITVTIGQVTVSAPPSAANLSQVAQIASDLAQKHERIKEIPK